MGACPALHCASTVRPPFAIYISTSLRDSRSDNFCDKEYYEIDSVAAEAGGGGGAGVSVTRVAAGGGAGAASWSGTPAAG